MVKATISTDSIFSITIEGLSLEQVNYLRDMVQNSRKGYSSLIEEPVYEYKLREAIHDACLDAINKSR